MSKNKKWNSKAFYKIHWVNDFKDGDVNTGKRVDYNYLNGMCDAHTHGLKKYCGHELQMTVNLLAYAHLFDDIAYKIIFEGLKLHDGMIIEGLFDDDAVVRISEVYDFYSHEEHQPYWRIIIPDGDFKMPEESEEYPYCFQMMNPHRQFYIDHKETYKNLGVEKEVLDLF